MSQITHLNINPGVAFAQCPSGKIADMFYCQPLWKHMQGCKFLREELQSAKELLDAARNRMQEKDVLNGFDYAQLSRDCDATAAYCAVVSIIETIGMVLPVKFDESDAELNKIRADAQVYAEKIRPLLRACKGGYKLVA